MAYQMKKANCDLYTDYLLSTFSAVTAIGLSAMVEGDVSHDQITRFLSSKNTRPKTCACRLNRRMVEHENVVLIVDDTIQKKAWTDESQLIFWYYDHCSGYNIKGINLFNALYHSNTMSIRVALKLMKKFIYCDLKTRQVKCKNKVKKNEMMRQMILYL